MELAKITNIGQDRHIANESGVLKPGNIVSSIEITFNSGKTITLNVSLADYDRIAAGMANMEVEDFRKLKPLNWIQEEAPPSPYETWFVLNLNDMRSSKIQEITHVVRARSRAELHDLIKSQQVEPYEDGQWRKVYRQGGPLEWYNGVEMFGSVYEVIPMEVTEGVHLVHKPVLERVPTLEQLLQSGAPEVPAQTE